MEKLHIPTTNEERRKIAKFVRGTLNECQLRLNWLILQLSRDGFKVTRSQASDLLSLRMVYPKGDEFLARAERICKQYRQLYKCPAQSEN